MTLTEVHDNYLSKNDFNQLKKLLLGNNFSYYLQDCIVSEGDGFFQFTHIFYDDQVIKSKHFDNMISNLILNCQYQPLWQLH